jgi:MFS family permease
MAIGIVVIGAGLFLLSQTQSLATYYASFVIITLGASATNVTAIMTIVMRWFRRRIGLATGITLSGFSLGGLAIPILNAVIETFDWRTAVMVLGGGTLLLAIPVLLLLRDQPDQVTQAQHEEFSPLVSPTTGTSGSTVVQNVSVPQALRMRAFWHILITFVLLTLVVMTVATHVMPYLSSVGFTRQAAGLVTMALSLISIVGRLGLGWLTDRWPNHTVMLFGLGIVAVGLVFFALVATHPLFIIPFLIAYPVGFGGAMVLRPPFVRHYFGTVRFGSIFGLTISAGMLGGILGPPLAGWTFDTTGSYLPAWYGAVAVLLVAMAVIVTCPRAESPDIPSGQASPGAGTTEPEG